MGIERARVVEVHAPTSPSGRVGSGYLIGDRLVLTSARLAGRKGPTDFRPAGTGVWMSSALVWAAASGAAVLEVDDPSALLLSPDRGRWGRLTGVLPVAVTAMGFGPSAAPGAWPRDPEQFFGAVAPGGSSPRPVTGSRPVTEGMSGAALFAGAELVGVLLADGPTTAAVPTTALADDAGFVGLMGDTDGLALTEVSTPSYGFPILQGP